MLRGVLARHPFTARVGDATLEWCDRALLARIHRYTLNRLRAEIEPVSPADFMRFLFAWQHVDPSSRLTGVDGLRAVVARSTASSWRPARGSASVLPARLDGYEPSMLDMLCLTGEVGWARLSPPTREADRSVVGATPIALFLREHARRVAALRDRRRREPTRDVGR